MMTNINNYALDEYESKKQLLKYGIPVVKETVVQNIREAYTAVDTIGYPVVIKGLGKTLLHKTETGLVHLNISNADELEKAFLDIKSKAKDKLEGVLIQPFIKGKREFVAGLVHDEQFGAIVMFGLGGVLTEALKDTTFRAAPLNRADAEEMIEEIRAKKLLDSFRGEQAVDREEIIRVLMGLSNMAMREPDIAEVDINPLVADANGRVTAVDALVIRSGSAPGRRGVRQTYDLKGLFDAKSIAFIGASGQFGKWGFILPNIAAACGFMGEIYLVNNKGGMMLGRTVYTSLLEIAEQIDVAVITVPAENVIGFMPELKQKGVRYVMVVSSGYSEAGNKTLETDLLNAAMNAGITLLGPNLMGMCNPYRKLNISIFKPQPEPGSIGLISQSGNFAVICNNMLRLMNAGLSKFCANGNEAMVGTEDFLEYFYNDDDTKVVVAYLERINDGKRFVQAVNKFSAKKPFVVLKGGQESKGSKAASSHTGGMRTDGKVFEAICKQNGIIRVDDVASLTDLGAAFSYLPLPKGNRVAIMTMGGGMGVITADQCERIGLEVPELSNELIEQFDKVFPPFWSRANPVDMINSADKLLPIKIMEALCRWDGCDIVLHMGLLEQSQLYSVLLDELPVINPEAAAEGLDVIIKQNNALSGIILDSILKLIEKYKKPIIGYGLDLINGISNTVFSKNDEKDIGSLFYPTPERAVFAARKMVEYGRYRQKLLR